MSSGALSPVLPVSPSTGVAGVVKRVLPSLLAVWVSPDKLSIYSSPANGMCNAYLSGQTHRGLVAKNINR